MGSVELQYRENDVFYIYVWHGRSSAAETGRGRQGEREGGKEGGSRGRGFSPCRPPHLRDCLRQSPYEFQNILFPGVSLRQSLNLLVENVREPPPQLPEMPGKDRRGGEEGRKQESGMPDADPLQG
jgi:hypothetical protein